MTASLSVEKHCGVSPNECPIVRACIGIWHHSAPRLSQNIHTFGIGCVVGIESVGLLFLYSRIDNNSYCKPLEWRFYKIYIANR